MKWVQDINRPRISYSNDLQGGHSVLEIIKLGYKNNQIVISLNFTKRVITRCINEQRIFIDFTYADLKQTTKHKQ